MSSEAPETKLVKALRTILSFIFAAVISTVSIACCFSASFLKPENVEKSFTSYNYTDGVRQNLLTYVDSYYQKSGFDTDKLGEIISYDAVKEAVTNYAGCYISQRVGFVEENYIQSIDKMIDGIKEDMLVQIKLTRQNNNEAMLNTALTSIKNYFTSEIAVKGSDKLSAVFNIGRPVMYAIIGAGVFLFVFITLILYFLGEKKYRSLRAITISFMTAGLFDICLAVIVLVISRLKKFDIYPIYLYDEFIRYVNTCIGTVVVAGFLCIMLSFIAAAITWKKKNKR